MLSSIPAWRRAVTVLCIVGVLTPAAVGAAADPQQELERVQRRLDRAKSGLEGVERRKAVQLEDLQRLDARRAELDRQLAELNTKLAVAESHLAESQAALDATTQQLTATEARLTDTRRQLEKDRALFAARARSTYMYGGRGGWTGMLVDIESVEQLERGMKYARSVLHDDQQRIERITGLERVVVRITKDLGKLQDRQAAQRAVDAERRDTAAAIVAQREDVAAQVDAEVAKRKLLVARLETDRRSYVAMVDNLHTQSRTIEQELAAIAAAERAAELEAQRKAAEEAQARRQAAVARKQAAPKPTTAAPPPSGGTTTTPTTPTTTTTALLWPANGPKTSDFGYRTHPIFGTSRFHAGIDIGAAYGTAISAARDGVVVSAGSMSGYGNTVVINHGGGLATLYAHQSTIAVSAGQSVSRGQVIGYIGSTGYSTGPHLHFETRVDGTPVDPMRYF